MGREAECICEWGAKSVTVRALLESGELVLRGAIRRKIPFSAMQQLRTEEGKLAFSFQGEEVLLLLGDATALKWCQVITAPPITLARKLGITPESFVWVLGETEDVELQAALATAKELGRNGADLIVAYVFSMEGLANLLGKTKAQLDKGVPLWVIYAKGKGHAVRESDIRSTARDIGLIDSKVASISATLTGLRFLMRK